MRIGIVTPAYNAAGYVGDAIRSVLTQSHTDWRLVVVDDGSDDATLAVAASLIDPRMQVIRQAHAGVSAARNCGMAALKADALLFLDADDALLPDALARLAAGLADAPWAAGVFGACLRGGRRWRPSARAATLARLLVRNAFANGGHVLLRQEVAEAAGGFRGDLAYGEDWEFWVRCALQGEFVPLRDPTPLCCIRERAEGAYGRMASDVRRYDACLQAIFANPALRQQIDPARLGALWRRAEAEKAWVIGRQLIRHSRPAEAYGWLGRSLLGAPTPRRVALAAAVPWLKLLPPGWRGPFSPYKPEAEPPAERRGGAVRRSLAG